MGHSAWPMMQWCKSENAEDAEYASSLLPWGKIIRRDALGVSIERLDALQTSVPLPDALETGVSEPEAGETSRPELQVAERDWSELDALNTGE